MRLCKKLFAYIIMILILFGLSSCISDIPEKNSEDSVDYSLLDEIAISDTSTLKLVAENYKYQLYINL